jgi:hypothetical protein
LRCDAIFYQIMGCTWIKILDKSVSFNCRKCEDIKNTERKIWNQDLRVRLNKTGSVIFGPEIRSPREFVCTSEGSRSCFMADQVAPTTITTTTTHSKRITCVSPAFSFFVRFGVKNVVKNNEERLCPCAIGSARQSSGR